METIKLGSKGVAVETLQKFLNLYVDGIFGKLTKEAVVAFQKANNITPDGVVGDETWKLLQSEDNSIILKTAKRPIKEIFLHCTATPEGKDYNVATIKKWHLQRGFSDIGYHYVVYRDGSVHEGRDINVAGAHCTGHNTGSIGISYVGGLDASGKNAKDTRTPEQKEALLKLVRELCKKYNIPKTKVYGHYQFANKACPSFKIEPFRAQL